MDNANQNFQTESDKLRNYENVVRLLIRLAGEASDAILKIYSFPDKVRYKTDGSPVTLADETANQIIVSGLRESFPATPILAEESPDNSSRSGSEWLFVVDPLDGTKEYIAANDEFSVNIALLRNNVPVVGVIQMPVTGQVFCAASGMGAWHNSGNGLYSRTFVSGRTSNIVLAMSRSHPSENTIKLSQHQKVGRTIVSGSSYKGCLIAVGDADVYYRFGRIMEWDTAAMECIVEEAGGLVRQMDGTKLIYNKPLPEHKQGFYILNREENKLILKDN